jgi:hypothetical protein
MALSFAKDIKTLFSVRDVQCMTPRGARLDDYAYMSDAAGDSDFPDHANARHVLARVTGDELPRMPLGAPRWTEAKQNTLASWIDENCPP